MTEQTKIMTDEDALNYAIKALQDFVTVSISTPLMGGIDEHCDNDEQREELAEAISVLSSMLDTYSTLSCNITLGEEEDAQA